jgi:hypothetical protein
LLASSGAETSVQGNAAEEMVSLAFTIDRKRNVLGNRIETTSDDLDAEAIAMLKRASPPRRRHRTST